MSRRGSIGVWGFALDALAGTGGGKALGFAGLLSFGAVALVDFDAEMGAGGGIVRGLAAFGTGGGIARGLAAFGTGGGMDRGLPAVGLGEGIGPGLLGFGGRTPWGMLFVSTFVDKAPGGGAGAAAFFAGGGR